jgi:alpha/beta hydrolase family protein
MFTEPPGASQRKPEHQQKHIDGSGSATSVTPKLSWTPDRQGVLQLDELPPAEARDAYEVLARLPANRPPWRGLKTWKRTVCRCACMWPPEPQMASSDGCDSGRVRSARAPMARGQCRLSPCSGASVSWAIEDMLTAARWVHSNMAEFGGDPDRMVVAGDSAGGTSTAVIGHQLHDIIRLQILLYPQTDLTMSQPSVDENAEGYLLTRNGCKHFRSQYLGEYADVKDPFASPLFAKDTQLAGAPPALVITAELDPLGDEGEAYAARLKEAGVPVDLVRFDGMIHTFYAALGAMIPATDEALDLVVEAVGKATASTAPTSVTMYGEREGRGVVRHSRCLGFSECGTGLEFACGSCVVTSKEAFPSRELVPDSWTGKIRS